MEHRSRRFGPIGTSCLTCRRRRKKCDKARPACERCTAGDFVCLGYGNDSLNEDISISAPDELSNDPENATNTPIFHTTQSLSTASSANSIDTLFAAPQDHPLSSTSRISSVASGSSSYASLGGHPYSMRFNHNALANVDSDSDSIMSNPTPACRIQITNSAHSTKTSRSLVFRTSTVGHHNPSNHMPCVNGAQQPPSTAVSLFVPRPQNRTPTPENTSRIVRSILLQYEQFIDTSIARPSYDIFAHFRERVKWHLEYSNARRVPALIGCRIMESFIDGTSNQKLAYYNDCMEKVEQHLRSGLDRSMTAAESYGRHSGILEIAIIKLIYAGGANTYRLLLRDTALAFVQVASVDTPLCTTPSGCTSVPLAHVLTSTQYHLTRFVFLDLICSMVYALPQLVEYTTSISPPRSDLNPTEWIYGCPTEFQFALIEINQRRSSPGRVGPEADWRLIEHRIKSWQPKPRSISDKHSWKCIARLTIQESWRHTLLVYLYMTAGGLNSDDVHIRTCVQQIYKLAGIIDQFGTELTDDPFIVQYLIAGICTPYETQRAKTKEWLSAISGLAGLWPLCGSEVVPVLNHLWHGAAANGRAIQWSDYVHSRRAVLPIVF